MKNRYYKKWYNKSVKRKSTNPDALKIAHLVIRTPGATRVAFEGKRSMQLPKWNTRKRTKRQHTLNISRLINNRLESGEKFIQIISE